MVRPSQSLFVSGSVFALVGLLIVACGEESKFKDGNSGNPTFGGGQFADGGGNPVDLYKNDPLPKWCGPGEDPAKGQITGTEECPSDKNKPGCGCENVGEEAPCWEGLRKHRNLGICKDGKTKCIAGNEVGNVWGKCEGQQLPTGPTGEDGCSCFSFGEWKIRNNNPCTIREGTTRAWAHATILTSDGKITRCFEPGAPPQPQPGEVPGGPDDIWSTSTLKTDCAGKFKLIYRIRAGDPKNPQPTDCILGEQSIEADYQEPNVEQPMPPLKPWAGADQACAKKWEIDTPDDVYPGYGEMIVRGQTVRCDEIDDGNNAEFVFHRLPYCPKLCRTNNTADVCKKCAAEATGKFGDGG